MKGFPMFIRTTGRRVVIVGGGAQAAQKARLMLRTDAAIVLVAPDLDPELHELVRSGRAVHETQLCARVFDTAAMAFIGSGCPGLDTAAPALARAARCPGNVVDRPELCDLTTPAIVDRDPVVVAIGSEGTAPVLTRDIKTRLESMLPQSLGGLAALAGRLRPGVNRGVARAQRRALWAWVFKGPPRDAWIRGAEREATSAIEAAIAAGAPPQGAAAGAIALVGAGPGARDLLTLRAVERLQEADVIFHDRLVGPDVLELARRDARRVLVGKTAGAPRGAPEIGRSGPVRPRRGGTGGRPRRRHSDRDRPRNYRRLGGRCRVRPRPDRRRSRRSPEPDHRDRGCRRPEAGRLTPFAGPGTTPCRSMTARAISDCALPVVDRPAGRPPPRSGRPRDRPGAAIGPVPGMDVDDLMKICFSLGALMPADGDGDGDGDGGLPRAPRNRPEKS